MKYRQRQREFKPLCGDWNCTCLAHKYELKPPLSVFEAWAVQDGGSGISGDVAGSAWPIFSDAATAGFVIRTWGGKAIRVRVTVTELPEKG